MNTTFVHVTTQEGSELEKGSQNLKKKLGELRRIFTNLNNINKYKKLNK